MEEDFSDEFCAFVQATLPSVEAAELLLHLAARPGACTPAEAVAELRPTASITDGEAARYFALFQENGLLAATGRQVRLSAATPELADHVATLARMYRQRPVTLIRLIYALRDSKVKSFAEAFKLNRR